MRNWIFRSFFFFMTGTLCAETDLFVRGLYWYTNETVDWAFTLSQNQNSVQTVYQTFVFDWAPGFSAGVKYRHEPDGWNTQASYTWFQSSASDHASGTVTPGFLAARLSLLEPFSTGKASMRIHYNMFDWDLGSEFLATEHLTFRPAIGVKGGWINQTILSGWTRSSLPGFTASENLQQKFQAGGAKGGVSGQWRFGNFRAHTFSLIGLFEAAYLWGHWSIQDQFTDSFSTVIDTQTTDRNFGSLVFHSFFGLGWDYRWRQDRNRVNLNVGYEIEDWLNQCQFFTDISGSQNNDLILQGLNGSLGVDF